MRRRSTLTNLPFAKPGAAPEKLLQARAMRCTPTPGEALLWAQLRDRRLDGWKFRRQAVIAGYIVDFFCPALRLAVEVDGLIHERQRIEDRDRDDDLAARGLFVLRVRDADVRARMRDVLDTIRTRCAAARCPLPPHRGGRAGDGGRENATTALAQDENRTPRS
jgi:very-short-patch-repair endonuclease